MSHKNNHVISNSNFAPVVAREILISLEKIRLYESASSNIFSSEDDRKRLITEEQAAIAMMYDVSERLDIKSEVTNIVSDYTS